MTKEEDSRKEENKRGEMTEERSVGGIEQDKWTRQTEEKTGILI